MTLMVRANMVPAKVGSNERGSIVVRRAWRPAAFFIVIVVLAVVRFAAKGFFDKLLTLEQTAALFFVLAFGMILRWRVSMYLEYRRIVGEPG
jgi:membrane protein CcdC involved in cytochrome C biogenesis